MSPPFKDVRSSIQYYFSIFFLSQPLPRSVEVIGVLQTELEKSKSKLHLLDYLNSVFTYLHLMDHKLIALAAHTVQGSYLNFKVIINGESDEHNLRFAFTPLHV